MDVNLLPLSYVKRSKYTGRGALEVLVVAQDAVAGAVVLGLAVRTSGIDAGQLEDGGPDAAYWGGARGCGQSRRRGRQGRRDEAGPP